MTEQIGNALALDPFEDILTMMKDETIEVQSLYEEIKTHYDTIKEQTRRMSGGLTFMSKQTENLIELRKTKHALLKAMMDLRNRRLGNQMKLRAMQTKEESDGEELPMKMFRYLIDSLKISPDSITKNVGVIDVTDEADALLDQRLLELAPDDDEEADDGVPNTDQVEVRCVVDITGEWHVINAYMTVLDHEYDLPEDPAVFDAGENGEIRAYTSDGAEVSIVDRDALVFVDGATVEVDE